MSPLGFHKLMKTIRRRERGQVLVLAAFSAVMVLGFTALVTDVGIYMRDMRDAQNDADAIVSKSSPIVPIARGRPPIS